MLWKRKRKRKRKLRRQRHSSPAQVVLVDCLLSLVRVVSPVARVKPRLAPYLRPSTRPSALQTQEVAPFAAGAEAEAGLGDTTRRIRARVMRAALVQRANNGRDNVVR